MALAARAFADDHRNPVPKMTDSGPHAPPPTSRRATAANGLEAHDATLALAKGYPAHQDRPASRTRSYNAI